MSALSCCVAPESTGEKLMRHLNEAHILHAELTSVQEALARALDKPTVTVPEWDVIYAAARLYYAPSGPLVDLDPDENEDRTEFVNNVMEQDTHNAFGEAAADKAAKENNRLLMLACAAYAEYQAHEADVAAGKLTEPFDYVACDGRMRAHLYAHYDETPEPEF